jgi:hypothetical protein
VSTELVTAIVLGLVINEFCDISPWLARKVIRLAARCVPDPTVRERLEEEWAAGLQDRPGKILKLFAALTLLVSAMTSVRRLYRPKRARLARSLVAAVFDREGRLNMGIWLSALLVDRYLNPWYTGIWSYLATAIVLAVTVHGLDLVLYRRELQRYRREQAAGRPSQG